MYSKKTYEDVATIICKNYQTHSSINMSPYMEMNRAVEEIALDFAEFFSTDNPNFDPVKFLNACSPDPERYPLGELWDEPDKLPDKW